MTMFLQICFLLSECFLVNLALQLNFYATVGQVRQEILNKDGFFRRYFPNQEYNSIIPGTIDFPEQKILEQDVYNSNEELRQTDVYIRLNGCNNKETVKAQLLDPYTFLVKYDSSRYSYVSRDHVEFDKDPTMDGMILSVQLNDSTVIKTNMTYLTRGLWWTPRYEVLVIDDQTATLRALADMNNEHDRSYQITSSHLITGTVPFASTSLRTPVPIEAQRVEYMASSSMNAISSISTETESTNFGSYSYNITRPFTLMARSIKTFPFLTTTVVFNYTLENTVYLSSGTSSGLFQRIFTIQPADFLPAGTITFYLAATGITLGQGRLIDTPKQSKQRISLANDPDVKYHIVNIITSTRQTPVYAQDLNVTVTITNRKERQIISATLTINSGYRNTTIISKTRSSSNIVIIQDPLNKSILTIRATIQANDEEKCMFVLKQSN